MSSPDDRPTTAPPAIDEASSNGQPSTARGRLLAHTRMHRRSHHPLTMRPESISLKRGREGSVVSDGQHADRSAARAERADHKSQDPQASETPTSSHIAAKKNRLETANAGADIVETDEDASAPTSLKPSGGDAGKEGHTVGEVRRKVEELNWEEGAAPRDGDKAEVDVDASEDSKDGSKADSKAASDAADSADWVKVSKPDEDGESAGTSESDSPSLKRKAGDEPDASSVASDEKKRKSTSVSSRCWRPLRAPVTDAAACTSGPRRQDLAVCALALCSTKEAPSYLWCVQLQVLAIRFSVVVVVSIRLGCGIIFAFRLGCGVVFAFRLCSRDFVTIRSGRWLVISIRLGQAQVCV